VRGQTPACTFGCSPHTHTRSGHSPYRVSKVLPGDCESMESNDGMWTGMTSGLQGLDDRLRSAIITQGQVVCVAC
jgi:hypothetical protein